MYQFSKRLKLLAFTLMGLGALGTAISFYNAPKTLQEAKDIMAKHSDSHGAHGDSHASDTHKKVEVPIESNTPETSTHVAKDKEVVIESHSSEPSDHKAKEASTEEHVSKTSTHEAKDKNITTEAHVSETSIHEAKDKEVVIESHSFETSDHKAKEVSTVAHVSETSTNEEKDSIHVDLSSPDSVKKDTSKLAIVLDTLGSLSTVKGHSVESPVHETKVSHVSTDSSHHDESHSEAHAEHVFHQMQNRPVAAFYVAMLYSLGISLLVLAFYAGQRIAQSGWSVSVFRVFEAITNNLHYVSVIMFLFIVGTVLHKFHLFPWMKDGVFDTNSPNYDAIIDAKKWWMNIPGWAMRSTFYLLGWNIFRYILRKKSIEQDNGDLKLHKRLLNISVGFVGLFFFTEPMASWDWIMGIDPHWFSTLFGWYVLSTFLVSALTVVAIVTIYLRSKGFLPSVNDSHIHDLAKFMFGFSVFWTYLWFSQFMLIWYSDMSEETTYFLQRFNEYQLPFVGMVALNFLFPVLLLLNSDYKSIPWFVILGGAVILIGHYVDVYVMIMPGTVGAQHGFGIGELSGLLFFTGLFIYATFSAFAKASPEVIGSPYYKETKMHHYYNIKHRGEDSNSHH